MGSDDVAPKIKINSPQFFPAIFFPEIFFIWELHISVPFCALIPNITFILNENAFLVAKNGFFYKSQVWLHLWNLKIQNGNRNLKIDFAQSAQDSIISKFL